MKRQRRGQASGMAPTLTKSVTRIRLVEVNPGKLAALDTLAQGDLKVPKEGKANHSLLE